MEYAGGGELSDWVKKNQGLSEIQTRNIILQITLAMQACHAVGVVHRDLKLENVLFDESKTRIKVVDFGIAGLVTTVRADKNTAATLKYMTPEMILSSSSVASPAMDVWAIGIMAYTMMFYKMPFSGANKEETQKAITTQEVQLP